MFRTRLLRMPRQALGLNLRASAANGSSFSANSSFNKINAARGLHSVPALPHDFSEGVPNLMSPGGFSLAWTDYMTVTVDKLNAMIAGKQKCLLLNSLLHINSLPSLPLSL
jgi:Fe-Mn family superoxide dismutase